MSQTNTSTSNNNRKRSSNTCTSPPPPPTTTTTGGDSGGVGVHFLAMKKAKSQAVSCSLDNKNGFQQHQFDNNSSAEPSSMIEDPTENDAGRASSAGGFTANLARKKATPPQPAKKFVIKLLKGPRFNLLPNSLSYFNFWYIFEIDTSNMQETFILLCISCSFF